METRYLYLDESGDSGWTPKYGGNSSEDYFIYAGAILSPEENYRLGDRVNQILNTYFSAEDKPEEIHYADICGGHKEYSNLEKEARSDLREDLFEMILDLEPTLTATVIDKNLLKKRYGNIANPPKSLAFRATIDRFHQHVEKRGMIGTAVIDAGEHSIDLKLRNLIYDAKSDGIKLDGANDDADTTLPHLMDTVNVSPSEMSPGIQLADIVAYQVRHEHQYSGESHGFEAISHLFRDPSDHRLTEPSVFPE